MDLSVIIVCYKGWEKLIKCLDSLDAFILENFSMEVIVVDNNSGDGRLSAIEEKFPKFRFVRNEVNGGYGYGCNRGAEKACGDFIMILNPDTVAGEKETFTMLERAKAHPEYQITSCRQVRDDGSGSTGGGRFPGLSLKNLIPYKTAGDVSFPDWVSGSLMLIGREAYSELNGFDEEFWMYYEDVDLCKRVRKAGGEIALWNDLSIIHDHGGSTRMNMNTTALTKCEVQVSRHVYISRNFTGLPGFVMHFLTIADNMVTGIIAGIAGLLFFFIPKLFVRVRIFINLIKYYTGALFLQTWISPRSVLYKSKIE